MSDNGKLLRKDLAEVKKPFISDSTYELFRNNVELVLPGVAVFYAAIALIWNLPFSTEIVGTIGALTVFLGVVIKANRSRIKKVEAIKTEIAAEDEAQRQEEEAQRLVQQAQNQAGDIVINTGDEGVGLVTLRLDMEPTEFKGLDEIRLKVVDAGLTPPE